MEGIVANAYAYGIAPAAVTAPQPSLRGSKIAQPEVFSTDTDSVVNHIVFRRSPTSWKSRPGRGSHPAAHAWRRNPAGLAAAASASRRWSWTIAAHTWLGKKFASYDFRERTKVLVINNEDDRDEMAWRMRAI